MLVTKKQGGHTKMEVKYNVTGSRRKEMVKIISEILKMKEIYLGMPSCAYVINNLTVSQNGTLIYDDRTENSVIEKVMEELSRAGFVAENIATSESKTNETNSTTGDNNIAHSENVGLTVAIPRESFTEEALQNLQKLIDAKGHLIKKALAVNSLPIEVNDEKILFPWFQDVKDRETIDAYTNFITALCNMAKTQNRITAKEKSTDNEKYAFKCFLLRLGFIGQQYKTARKILLRNLSGSSAFKNIVSKEVSSNEIPE